MNADPEAERLVQELGTEVVDAFPSGARHPLKAIDAHTLELAASDRELRNALFRFIDVVPACRSLDELARHLSAFLEELDEPPKPIATALRIAHTKAGRAALGAAAAAGVRHMAHRFIVGETPQSALPVLRGLWDREIASSVDLLGEATVSESEADAYAQRCVDALDTLASATASWPSRPRLEQDGVGPLPRANLSVKVSALTPLQRPEAPELAAQDARERMRALLRRARSLGAHLHIDMESLDSREVVLELVLALLSEDEFRQGPSAGLVLQAYLRDSPEQLDRMLDWARSCERAQPIVVRLVKGAYWDHEVVEARQHGWPAPVFEIKAECDRNFEQLTRTLLGAGSVIRVAIGSHNVRSVAHALAVNRTEARDDRDLELQVLRGLGDDLGHALARLGFRVRTYCPVGNLVAGMAYLVRRLLENTSSESFLHEQARGTPLDVLLAPP